MTNSKNMGRWGRGVRGASGTPENDEVSLRLDVEKGRELNWPQKRPHGKRLQ